MKKILLSMLMVSFIGLTIIACSKGPSVKEIVEKAKTEGENWSEDDWIQAYKQVAIASKPYTMEQIRIMEPLLKNAKILNADDEKAEAEYKKLEPKLEKLNNKYSKLLAQTQEFNNLMSKNKADGYIIVHWEEIMEWTMDLYAEWGISEDAISAFSAILSQ